MKVQELINLISENKLYSLCDAEDLIGDKATKVDSGIDLDSHRWFSIAADVYKCDDGYVGVYGVFQNFSEMQTYEDINILCEAEEFEAITRVSYLPINR